jgi:hypothetical protein
MGELVDQVKQIVGFGDSFVFGTELKDNANGNKSWVAQAAKALGCDYQTTAEVSVGNEHIARQIYNYFSTNDSVNTLAVINWTWSMRWDFYILAAKKWVTLGPTCVPSMLTNFISNTEAQSLIEFYNCYTGLSQEWNQIRSLQAIYAVQQFLKNRNIANVQTYMDYELFKINQGRSRLEHYQAYRDPSWPDLADEKDLDTLLPAIQKEVKENFESLQDPMYIQMLQKLTLSDMMDFEGTDFLTWSRNRNFAVSPTPGDHPMEEAHACAAKLWQPVYAKKLGIS